MSKLQERRLEVVAATVARSLLEKEMVSGISETALAAVLLRLFEADRAQEQAIDDEARKLMQKHAPEIARGNMDTGQLIRKFKAQLAKEKGFTL